MRKEEAVALLQWALPQLGFRWRGFRKVRLQVQKRIERRMSELGLARAEDYRRHLETQPGEWAKLDAMCRISISRFHRDRDVWDLLARRLLPDLATRARSRPLVAWSAGCAAGEEPYTLAIVARLFCDPPIDLRVLGTDTDTHQLERARAARYPRGSLKELPEALRDRAFSAEDDALILRPDVRAYVDFLEHDLRSGACPPPGTFELVTCRYLAFTYFDDALQEQVADTLAGCIPGGGVLVLGKHERLPESATAFEPMDPHRRVYRRKPDPSHRR